MEPIKLCPCVSSQISGFGYDSGSQTLAVKFKHGGLYHYTGVPADVFSKMQEAESVGSFLHREIKTKFPYKKQEQDHENP